jgi:hypothetical protein
VSFFSHLLSARTAARDLDRRVRLFRAEVVAARSACDETALAALRARPVSLGLTEDDVALELEMVDGLLEVIALKKAAAEGAPLPEVPTSHRALAGETCRFVAPAFRPDSPNDPGGKLFFTDRRIVYLGSPSLTVSWAHVVEVRDADRDLIVRVRPDAIRTFRCNSYVDTLRGAYLAAVLVDAVRVRPSSQVQGGPSERGPQRGNRAGVLERGPQRGNRAGVLDPP